MRGNQLLIAIINISVIHSVNISAHWINLSCVISSKLLTISICSYMLTCLVSYWIHPLCFCRWTWMWLLYIVICACIWHSIYSNICFLSFIFYPLVSPDCIGSAFNAKGIMQCPNCRTIEMGNWLYANGFRASQDVNNDEWGYDDLYDAGHSDLATFVVSERLSNFCICVMGFLHWDWELSLGYYSIAVIYFCNKRNIAKLAWGWVNNIKGGIAG